MHKTWVALYLGITMGVSPLLSCGDDDGETPPSAGGGDAAPAGTGGAAAGRPAVSGSGSAGSGGGEDWGSMMLPGTCGAPRPHTQAAGNRCPAADPVALKTTRVGTGFEVAVFVTQVPGDPRLAVVERGGTVQLLDPTTGVKTLFFDLEDRPRGHELLAATAPQGEQGLLGLAFHPEFPADRRFFVNYTARASDDVTVVSMFEASSPDRADPASEQVLLQFGQPQGNHNGGMIAFGPDGCLFVGSGDGGNANDVGAGHAPGGNGQSLATNLGKLLRIDVDKPTERPPGNLESAGIPHVWDYGLRNPWRFSFDRLKGDLYLGDVGQGAWEEIDVEPNGRGNLNYGWPIMEGNDCLAADSCDRQGLALPVDQYETTDENDSVIGGYVYRGEKIPSLRGWYIYGDNGASSNGKVATFVWNGSGRCNDRTLELQTRDKLALDADITSLGEDEAGEVYIVTRRSVYRLDPK